MLRNVIKRRKTILVVAILLIQSFNMFIMSDHINYYFIHWRPLNNISCHYMDEGDVLEAADSREFPPYSIFYLETSCKGGLDSRQACSVESAARAHPHWNINVLFTAPGTKESLKKCSSLLREFKNVKFFRIHPTKYANGTPLEHLIANGAFNRTIYPIIHTSDLLRFLTLYKWGGVYLDLDAVVVKPLTTLAKNWAARESTWAISVGALAFSGDRVGRSVATAALRDIKWNYRGDKWGHNGPGVITRILRKMCSTTDVTMMSAATCNGFEVYGPELFYPIEWQKSKIYFEVGELPPTDVYVHHVWNHVTQDLRAVRGSPYHSLAKKYCPTVYKIYSDNFG